MKIDLHAHSTASDGTDTPAELVAQAAAAGLDVVAITDHDGLSGWDEAADAVPVGLTLIRGVELSAAADVDGRRIDLHLLGYLPDPGYAPLAEEMTAIRKSRVGRARRIVEAIAADGYPVSWDSVRERAQGAVGRPHIASELVDAGLVATVSDAFSDAWIGPHGRYYLSERKVPVLEAIALVRAAGGAPVFAHPGAAQRGATVPDSTIAQMTAAGLVGLEVDHPDHDAPTRAHLRGVAAELGLLVTGSSDYHGSRKPTKIGAELTDPEAYAALLAAAAGSPVVTRA
jgi:predicted metal-dependent phosphoesterase TrpH